jgi:hypothetical protein
MKRSAVIGCTSYVQRRPGLPKKAAYQPASILEGTHRPEAKYTRPVLRQPISDKSSFIYIQQSPKSLPPKLTSFTSLPARAEMQHPPSSRLEVLPQDSLDQIFPRACHPTLLKASNLLELRLPHTPIHRLFSQSSVTIWTHLPSQRRWSQQPWPAGARAGCLQSYTP